MKKRIFAIVLSLILVLSLLSACGGNSSVTSTGGDIPANDGDNIPVNKKEEQTPESTLAPTQEQTTEEPTPEPTPEPTTPEPTTPEPTTPEPTAAPDIQLTLTQFDELLAKQDMCVISTKYVVQDDRYKTLYPDMLQAVIKNNTGYDIRNAVVAFVAWDGNNLPVKIKGNIDFSDGSYVKKVNYSDINLIGGATYGESSGMSIDEDCNISKFRAIVISYETFDNVTWTNPYYNAWEAAFSGQKFKDDITVTIPPENNMA